MSTKLLDTFVRISKSTRAKMRSHCNRNNLQQGRFADSAILAAIDGAMNTAGKIFPAAAGNGHKPARRQAVKG